MKFGTCYPFSFLNSCENKHQNTIVQKEQYEYEEYSEYCEVFRVLQSIQSSMECLEYCEVSRVFRVLLNTQSERITDVESRWTELLTEVWTAEGWMLGKMM